MKLGYMMLLVAVGTMLVVAPSAMAADKAHGDKNVVYGVVKEVGKDSITVTVKAKKDAPAAEPKTIKITDATKVVVGDKDGTIADVKADAHVAVTLDKDGAAAKIAVMPPHEKKTK